MIGTDILLGEFKLYYDEIRPQIKSGDLLAWSHRTPWYKSWHDFKISIVRMFTKSEYSHVATAWVVGSRVLAIEAVIPVVRIFPLSRLGDFYLIPLKAPWSDKALNMALSKIGEPYSQLQAIQAFFELPKEDGFWECAELVRSIALCDGIDLGDKATPSEIVRSAMKYGNSVILVESLN